MPPRTSLWELFWTNNEPYSARDQQHKKAWCMPCVEEAVELFRRQEFTQIAHGTLVEENRMTDTQRREKAVLAVKFICGKSEQMINHMKTCKTIQKSSELTQKREDIITRYRATKIQRQPLQQLASFQPNSTHFPSLPTPIQSASSSMASISPRSGSARESQQISHSNKRLRTSSSFPVAQDCWDSEQQEFNQDLVRLFAACGFSWNSANNPETTLFFGKYVPQARVPDRRVLSGTILDREVNRVEGNVWQQVQGQKATYQADGWKNIAKTNVISSMMTAALKICLS
ncbi:hypothetical protein PQX77_014513 [Marasmius sp. AFHP31]|nr:hypothetical protein PQX77_014513 [Marasmius sp. AFHP31]